MNCSIDGCERRVKARGLCDPHYKRWWRNGTTERQRAAPRVGETCDVGGCMEPIHAHGFCSKHAHRYRRYGDPEEQLRASPGEGWVQQGYHVVHADHPVASPSGRAFVHRMILYDAIGPGSHACHWCGVEVTWDRVWPEEQALVTDHLDNDTLNNDRANLVPSCHPCNAARGGEVRWAQ